MPHTLAELQSSLNLAIAMRDSDLIAEIREEMTDFRKYIKEKTNGKATKSNRA